MSEKSPWIVDTTQEAFEQDVIQRSYEVPVVVDFWAAWCHPCRILGPVLEQLAQEYDGKFVLVKADTDQMPNIAAAFGVQGIPAVFGLRDGKLVGQFTGVLGEPEIRRFLDGLMPSEAEQLMSEARLLEVSDPAAAEAKFRQAVEKDPRNAEAKIALAGVLLQQDRLDESRQLIGELAERGFLEPEAERIQAELSLRSQAEEAGDVAALRRELAASPNDLNVKLQLARALIGAGQHAEALQLCLEIVETDRKGLGEQAKDVMVDTFHLLGNDSDLVTEYRRKLSMALY